MLDGPFAVDASLVQQMTGSRNEYGEFVPGATVTTVVRVVTVPLMGDERDVLPEGLREKDVRKFWMTETVMAIVSGEADGDILRFDGIDYRVMRADNWSGFYEVLAVRPEAVPT